MEYRSFIKAIAKSVLGFSGLALSLNLVSCVSSKNVTYFQADTTATDVGRIAHSYVAPIQTGDLLSIVVGSLSEEANEIFNVRNNASAISVNYSSTGGGAKLQPVGYSVSTAGTVELPLVGPVKVAGLSTVDAADTLRLRLSKYLVNPTVVVRSSNFKISVLGEVRNPSVFVIPDERITLPEALGLAGDLTIYGTRNNVLVIREENGTRQFGVVDLTSRKIFDSPYYFLHKNDVVYVEPTKSKVTSSDRTLQILPLVLSGISVIAVILTRIF